MNKLKLYFLKSTYWFINFLRLLFNIPLLCYWLLYIAIVYSGFINVSTVDVIGDTIATIIFCAFYIGDRIEKQNKQSI